jgi:hypothetical protein
MQAGMVAYWCKCSLSHYGSSPIRCSRIHNGGVVFPYISTIACISCDGTFIVRIIALMYVQPGVLIRTSRLEGMFENDCGSIPCTIPCSSFHFFTFLLCRVIEIAQDRDEELQTLCASLSEPSTSCECALSITASIRTTDVLEDVLSDVIDLLNVLLNYEVCDKGACAIERRERNERLHAQIMVHCPNLDPNSDRVSDILGKLFDVVTNGKKLAPNFQLKGVVHMLNVICCEENA